MIGDLLYACPACQHIDALYTRKGRTTCTHCGATFVRRGRLLGLDGRFRDCADWFAKVRDLPTLPWTRNGRSGDESNCMVSQEATLLQARPAGRYSTGAGVRAELEQVVPVDKGKVVLTKEGLQFLGEEHHWRFPWQEITCVTTDARNFVFKVRGQRYFQVRFLRESPLKYEYLCRQALRSYWQGHGGKQIVEFQPHVTFSWPVRPEGRNLVRPASVTPAVHEPFTSRLFYACVKMLGGLVLGALFAVRVHGRHNIPKEGPFVLVINHEGYLDSFFTLTLLPRKVSYLAKNTEFKSRAACWVMRQLRVIPVRRHETDPSVVRNALRVLQAGEPVGIFVEGERTWDGRALPPKVGTVRFLVRAGVPIVPVRIRGSFEVLPRWDSHLQRHKVTLTVGRPFRLPFAADQLQQAGEYLMGRIMSLGEA